MSGSVLITEGNTSGVASNASDRDLDVSDLASMYFGAMVATGFSPHSTAEGMVKYGEEVLAVLNKHI